MDSARAKGLTDIAFTDHDRYHAGVDFGEIERLREANPDMKIRAGIELDNDPVHSAAGRRWVEEHWEQLDFVLGSVHFLERPDQMFDSVPEGAAQFEGRAIDEIYADYFRRVREMAASGLVDCLAHIDLIKIHGHRPSGDVAALAAETLDFIAARGLGDRAFHGRLAQTGERALSVRHLDRGGDGEGDSVHDRLRRAFARAVGGKLRTPGGENGSACGITQVCVFERHQKQMRPLEL